jgi:iduronate 2-sulfatase
MLKSKNHLVIIGLICTILISCKPQRPNVLFIISDDLGAMLGSYGDMIAVTPNLDRLAAEGVVFKNTFCQYPTCGPSRASLFSGLYPFENGYTSNAAKFSDIKGVKSLPRLLKENGYFTARVGKIFHMGIPRGIGKPGEDDSLAWDIAINNSGWDAVKENWEKATQYGSNKSPGVSIRYAAPDIPDDQMADGQGLKEAIRLLKENHPKKTGKPFFLAYGIYRPHPPMIAPKKHWNSIDISRYAIPEFPGNDRGDIPEINWHLKGDGFNFIPDSIAVSYAHAYYAAIHFVDELVGNLIDQLAKEGLSDNTIIVFTGDQGFMLGEHGHWHKSSMFEPSCKVPLIIVDPRKKESGVHENGMAGLIDIYPTLCELTGVQPEHVLSGKSLFPQLIDVHAPSKQIEYTMGTPGAYSVRTANFRYTEWRKDKINASDSMLYDLSKDRNEFFNLVGVKEYEVKRMELKELLDQKLISNTK